MRLHVLQAEKDSSWQFTAVMVTFWKEFEWHIDLLIE